MRERIFSAILVMSVFFCFFAPCAWSIDLAVSTDHHVNRYDLDAGTSTNLFAIGTAYAGAVAFDSFNDQIYYTVIQGNYNDIWRDTGMLFRYNNGSVRMGDIDIDPVSRKLAIHYNDGQSPSPHFIRNTTINTRNVDTGSQTLVYEIGKWAYINQTWKKTHEFDGVAVDSFNQKVYWADTPAGRILRGNIDGTGSIEVVYSGLDNPHALALDVGSASLFFSDATGIRRGTMSGAGPADVISSMSTYARSIDVDPSSSEIYWVQDGIVKKANYNGTGIVDVTNSSGNPIAANCIAIGQSTGSTPQNPFLPDVIDPVDGFLFDDVPVDEGMDFFDPDYAIGYDYSVTGTNFASVLLPAIGDGMFDLYLWNGSGFVFEDVINAGEEYVFDTSGVGRFRILGIEEDAMLDPGDPQAFLTGLSFTSSTTADITMNAIVPEPATMLLLSIGGLLLIRKQK